MIDKQSAPQYTWGDGCDGWHLVQTPELSIIEERMPEVRQFHHNASQFFYVLLGSLTIEVGGAESILNPWAGMLHQCRGPHQVHNQGAADVEFLVASNPPSHGDRIPAEAVD